jgi:hypothetical protein
MPVRFRHQALFCTASKERAKTLYGSKLELRQKLHGELDR